VPLEEVVGLLHRWRDADSVWSRSRVLADAAGLLARLTPAERRLLAEALAAHGAPDLARHVEDRTGLAVGPAEVQAFTDGLLDLDGRQLGGLIASLEHPEAPGPTAPPPPPGRERTAAADAAAATAAGTAADEDAGEVDVREVAAARLAGQELGDIRLGHQDLGDVRLDDHDLGDVRLDGHDDDLGVGDRDPEPDDRAPSAEGRAPRADEVDVQVDVAVDGEPGGTPGEAGDAGGADAADPEGPFAPTTAVTLHEAEAPLVGAEAARTATRLVGELRASRTAGDRLRRLSDAAVAALDAPSALVVLDAVPAGWQRRRAARRLTAGGAFAGVDPVALLARFPATSDRTFVAGDLVATGALTPDDLADLLPGRTVARLATRRER
jgi:hypothetical protein